MIKRETDFLSALESNISILIKIARVYAYTTQDRKDLVNDIILELWKSYPKFKGDSKISNLDISCLAERGTECQTKAGQQQSIVFR